MSYKNNEPLVSIVIPVYNAEKYLEISLCSVMEQSYTNLQIICVDDGSLDNSLDIMRRLEKRDSRVFVISKENEGAGVARNTGMKVAEGKYIYFFDADDYLRKNAIKEAVKIAEKNEADIVLFGYYKFAEKKKINVDYSPKTLKVPLNKAITPESISNRLFQADHGMPWNKIYKLEFVKESKVLFQSLMNTNDEFFSRITAVEAKRIIFVNKVFVGYRVGNQKSLQGNTNKNILDCTYALSAIYDELKQRKMFETYKETYKRLAGYIVMLRLLKAIESEGYEVLANEVSNNILTRCEVEEYYLEDRFRPAYRALKVGDIEKAECELKQAGLKS